MHLCLKKSVNLKKELKWLFPCPSLGFSDLFFEHSSIDFLTTANVNILPSSACYLIFKFLNNPKFVYV